MDRRLKEMEMKRKEDGHCTAGYCITGCLYWRRHFYMFGCGHTCYALTHVLISKRHFDIKQLDYSSRANYIFVWQTKPHLLNGKREKHDSKT